MSTIRYEYEPGYCGELIASNGHVVATFTDEPSKDDARRLVACWNACHSIPTYQLTGANDEPNDLGAMIDVLRAQRDELLEALKAMVECSHTMDILTCANASQMANTAIAKATGQKGGEA